MGDPELTADQPNELRWKITSASVVGSSHIRSGQPCQDSSQFRYLQIPGAPADTLVAAVADGAGSAPYSGQGSRLAAAASINAVAVALTHRSAGLNPTELRALLTESVEVAHQAVNDLARSNGHRLREYATTLLVAVHVNGLFGAAQIGDGAIVATREDGEHVAITTPDRGEYANETSFVTEPRSVDEAQIKVFQDIRPKSIAMFSDGIQNLVLDYRGHNEPIPHAPFFSGVFSWLEQQPDELSAYIGLRRFLKSSLVSARTNDDVSLLLARLMVA